MNLLGKHIRKDAKGANHITSFVKIDMDAGMQKEFESKPNGFVAGWASTADMDSYRHVVVGGAFQESINDRGLSGPRGIKLLAGHSWEKLAGKIEVLEYRGDRLWIEAQLNLDISYVRDLYEAAKMNGGLSFSVGFELKGYGWEEDENENEFLRIDRGDLYEISVVPFPGNEAAQMTFIKTRDALKAQEAETTTGVVSEFEKALVASGLAKSRNHASRITDAIKSDLFKEHAATFGFSKIAPVAPAEKKAPPVSAAKLTRLQEKLAALKAARASMETPDTGKE